MVANSRNASAFGNLPVRKISTTVANVYALESSMSPKHMERINFASALTSLLVENIYLTSKTLQKD